MSNPCSDDFEVSLSIGDFTNKVKIFGYGMAYIYLKLKKLTDFVFLTMLILTVLFFLSNVVNLYYPLWFLEWFSNYAATIPTDDDAIFPRGITISLALIVNTILGYALVIYLGTNMLLCYHHRRLYKKNS
ncbi:MAG: hypothetical protein Harvfovirus27_20 [Harvfovirus sp.]|uniref:Uncharacterized protein n=1 Tax=Harvfovirus sp. TaxID=2487768 RepID=A0A3G5A523_9VIRU|nr:MAG: hypothetical protein Harvfovirus27_20 [Harvfovirus sp.]